MPKIIKKENYRLEVYLPNPGDLGFAYISGIKRGDDETIQELEQMKEQIIRHVDGAKKNNVIVIYDEVPQCSFCKTGWTEDTEHNGGCCDKDGDLMDSIEKNRLGSLNVQS